MENKKGINEREMEGKKKMEINGKAGGYVLTN